LIGGYEIQSGRREASPRVVDPGDVIFKHHLTGHAQVKIETLTDGQLLHVAVFGCFLTTSSE
jgi:hypothetical protein